MVALDVLTPLLPAADILNEMIKAIRKVCLLPTFVFAQSYPPKAQA